MVDQWRHDEFQVSGAVPGLSQQFVGWHLTVSVRCLVVGKQCVGRASDQRRGGDTEQSLRRGVDVDHVPVRVGHDDGVAHRLDDQRPGDGTQIEQLVAKHSEDQRPCRQ